jgi:hypothetical protein
VGLVIFVAAVIHFVLPGKHSTSPSEVDLATLKTRLADERNSERKKLEDTLSEWELKNQKLEMEIARLCSATPETGESE